MITQSVGLDQFRSSWPNDPGYEELLVIRAHHSGEMIELPVARIRGAKPGPCLTVMSGMHAGEYSGILAAQQLISAVDPMAVELLFLAAALIELRK